MVACSNAIQVQRIKRLFYIKCVNTSKNIDQTTILSSPLVCEKASMHILKCVITVFKWNIAIYFNFKPRNIFVNYLWFVTKSSSLSITYSLLVYIKNYDNSCCIQHMCRGYLNCFSFFTLFVEHSIKYFEILLNTLAKKFPN